MPFEVIPVKPATSGFKEERTIAEVAADIKKVYDHAAELSGNIVTSHQIAMRFPRDRDAFFPLQEITYFVIEYPGE